MPVTDALLWVHGTTSLRFWLRCFLTRNAQYSTNSKSTSALPRRVWNLSLPSRVPVSHGEGLFAFRLTVVGTGGVEMGPSPCRLGCSPFDTSVASTVATLDAVSAATTNATTIIASRPLTLAQLAVNGAHYFIPVNTGSGA